jgi:opacity protein-like surface antigen
VDPATPAVPAVEPPGQAAQRNPLIIGIGAGAAFEPDPIFPVVYARIGRFVSRNASVSLRPRYIFGTTDLQGKTNSEGVFQVPLTLDLQLAPWLSPYLGGGVSTNTDNTGRANGMVSLGADISISRNLAIDFGVNYIVQPNANDSNGGDFELTSVLYLRF